MDNCQPCKDVDGYLLELSKTYDFDLETFNISPDTETKQRRQGKRFLAKYGTIKVPLLVFTNEKGEEFAAIYREHITGDVEEYMERTEKILEENVKQTTETESTES